MWASSLEKAIAHPAAPGDPAGSEVGHDHLGAAAEGFELDPDLGGGRMAIGHARLGGQQPGAVFVGHGSV
mgnify:CR=1 FL=1